MVSQAKILLVIIQLNIIIKSIYSIATTKHSETITQCRFNEYSSNSRYGNIIEFFCDGDNVQANAVERIYFGNSSEIINCQIGLHDRYLTRKEPKIMHFNGCALPSISALNIFKWFQQIRVLNISFVGLQTIHDADIGAADYLTTFDASHNQLHEIPATLFTKTKNLRLTINSIDISHNNIQKLSTYTFRDLQNFEVLNLNFNNIREIEQQTFVDLTYLTTIDLSHNHIEQWMGAFERLPSLRQLNLSTNDIQRINRRAFFGIENLMILDLSYNNIEELTDESFIELMRLKHLNLSHVHLKAITPKTFSNARDLETLDLSHNQLVKFDFNLLWPFHNHLESLYLNGNQLNELTNYNGSVSFGHLIEFQIGENNFLCSYLKRILSGANFIVKFPSVVVNRSGNQDRMHVHGIDCKETTASEGHITASDKQMNASDSKTTASETIVLDKKVNALENQTNIEEPENMVAGIGPSSVAVNDIHGLFKIVVILFCVICIILLIAFIVLLFIVLRRSRSSNRNHNPRLPNSVAENVRLTAA